jgi:hypothetical protein
MGKPRAADTADRPSRLLACPSATGRRAGPMAAEGRARVPARSTASEGQDFALGPVSAPINAVWIAIAILRTMSAHPIRLAGTAVDQQTARPARSVRPLGTAPLRVWRRASVPEARGEPATQGR